jgi:DNA-binding transcriptional regulator YiaG
MASASLDPELIAYFWSLIDKNGPLPDPSTGVKSRCWLWIGSVRQDGYGRFKYDTILYQPTRFAWTLKTGRDPGPLNISAKCHHKTCVRHLVARTREELGRATVDHLRTRGEDHPNTTLTNKQVLQIRELYRTGKFSQKELAARFKVSPATLRNIVRRKSWRHI